MARFKIFTSVRYGDTGSTVDRPKGVRNSESLSYRTLQVDLPVLFFVIQCGRPTETMHENHASSHRGICDHKILILTVITNYENEKPATDTWWTKNELVKGW